MEASSVEITVRALNAADVRYLVAGGLAVVAHGYPRFTADLGLILDLEPDNVERAISALTALGYRPRAPVAFEAFGDANQRVAWMRDKGMTVFSLSSAAHALTEIDLLVDPPLDFGAAYRRAAPREIAPEVVATFLGFDDLIRLKEQAARPQDKIDIDNLRALRRQGSENAG